MATLIQNLNLANTFGEWVSITNETVSAYNTIYASDFTKPTGTLYLSGPGTSLSVANGSVFTGLVDISGAGSLLVRHNAEVQNTLYLTNKDGGSIHSLVFSANGVANVNYINITGAGRSANVANNAWIGGTLTVVGNTAIGANCTVVDDITANNETISYHINVGRDVSVGRFLTVTNMTKLNGITFVNAQAIIQSTATVNALLSNSYVYSTVSNSLKTYSNDYFANNIIYGNTMYSSNTITSNSNIIANSGTVFANVLSANNIRFSGSLITTSGTVQAANGIFGAVTVSGNFNIVGQTVYTSNVFVLSDGAAFPGTPQVTNQFGVLRVSRSSANAEVRWNNNSKWWEYRNVDDTVDATSFQRILSANDYVSINTSITTANTNLKSYVDTADISLQSQISANVSSLQGQISANAVSSNAMIVQANTAMKSYVDTSVTSLQSQISANAVSSNAMIVQANSAMKTYVDGNFLRVASGGSTQTIASDVTITGNFAVNGTTTYINTQTITTQDSLIRLANNNTSSDSLDIGFIAPYQTGGFTRYTGLFRKAGTGTYYLGQSIPNDPAANVVQNFGVNFRATLDANFTGGTVSNLSQPIPLADGGTGQTSGLAAIKAFLDQIPGQQVNYVLTTLGAGNYSWSAGGAGGGGGVTPGTTIISTRSANTANGVAGYSGNSFSIPAFTNSNQVRAYINGVRQYESEYSLQSGASSNTIIFSTTPSSGDLILVEVDGYYVNPYYANNITFTAPYGSIPSGANTIQLAIQDLETRKAALASPALTGLPTSVTPPTGTSNTVIATTAFVNNLANSNFTFSHSISGNALTATNAITSNFAIGAGNANTSNFALTAGAANTAGYITNSSYNGFGLRTIQPTSSGVPTGGSSGDIVYQY